MSLARCSLYGSENVNGTFAVMWPSPESCLGRQAAARCDAVENGLAHDDPAEKLGPLGVRL